MKLMKKSMKCLVAVLLMAMAFAVTGITAQAMEATYVPAKYTDLSKNPGIATKTYVVPAYGEVVIPIKVAGKGGLEIGFAGQDAPTTAYEDLYGRIYADAACTTSVGYLGYIGTTADVEYITVDKATTVYLQIDNSSRDYNLQCAIAVAFIDGNNRTIKVGQTTAIYTNDSSKWVYTKFKATKTGYVTTSVAGIDGYGIYTKLCNSKKQALSTEEYLSNESTFYGVQKNKTYYIATKTYNDAYNLRVKQTSVSDKSGSKKTKALSMKKKKTYKGVQIANKKKSGTDWYKIKLTSRKALKITVNGKTSGYNGSLMIKISGGSGRWSTNTGRIPCAGKTTFTTTTLSPGTYYLQVYKSDKLASGYYTISWK